MSDVDTIHFLLENTFQIFEKVLQLIKMHNGLILTENGWLVNINNKLTVSKTAIYGESAATTSSTLPCDQAENDSPAG